MTIAWKEPSVLLSLISRHFHSRVPADEQGHKTGDEGLEGMYEWIMDGLWKDDPWTLYLHMEADGSYRVTLYTIEDPYDDANNPDLVLHDDEESARKLYDWVASQPSGITYKQSA